MPPNYFSLTFIILIIVSVISIVISIIIMITAIVIVVIVSVIIITITATLSRYFLAPGLDCVTNPPPGETMGKKLPTAIITKKSPEKL